ncbi:MAG TPA: PaaI family thioesterase [Xanthobacteraceae bacterium]|nr:PaaI family thioesterase [Xanthobacteraceae bacterium]
MTEQKPFDPAAAGWTLIENTGFGDRAGPLWHKGDALYGFLAEQKHLNFNNVVHGGMMTTLADQAMGMTAMRANGHKPHATIELNIQFIGAVRLGEFAEAHCEVVRATRSIIFMRATTLVGTRVVGTATGIWKIYGEH